MPILNKDTKIYIAGHRGLVGSAIWKNLKEKGYNNLIGRTHTELDLTRQSDVEDFFNTERPDVVILAAAFVGGIMANSLYRADFIMENMKMQCNVISSAYQYGVKKLLFLGSTCIYPKLAPQPIPEDALLTSPLEYSNEEYAIAKIAGLKMCESYNLQYGTNYIAVMPTNLYGPNDNFHLANSHVLPAMMRKITLAHWLQQNDWDKVKRDIKQRPLEELKAEATKVEILSALAHYGIAPGKVNLWGTGKPLREFLWSEDMADACVYLLLNINFSDIIGYNTYSSAKGKIVDHTEINRNTSIDRGGALPELGEIRNTHINIGTGKEISIAQLAQLVKTTIGFKGEINFDTSKPDGTPRKLTNVDKLHHLGWTHKIDIEEGIKRLYDWYIQSIS